MLSFKLYTKNPECRKCGLKNLFILYAKYIQSIKSNTAINFHETNRFVSGVKCLNITYKINLNSLLNAGWQRVNVWHTMRAKIRVWHVKINKKTCDVSIYEKQNIVDSNQNYIVWICEWNWYPPPPSFAKVLCYPMYAALGHCKHNV